MADYINREKIQYREIVDYYDEQNMCEIHCDVADKVKIERLPTADVVEREKIDKAIEEIEQEIQNGTIKVTSGGEKLFNVLKKI